MLIPFLFLPPCMKQNMLTKQISSIFKIYFPHFQESYTLYCLPSCSFAESFLRRHIPYDYPTIQHCAYLVFILAKEPTKPSLPKDNDYFSIPSGSKEGSSKKRREDLQENDDDQNDHTHLLPFC